MRLKTGSVIGELAASRAYLRLAADYRDAAGDAGRAEKVLTGRVSHLNSITWRWMDNYGMALSRAILAAGRNV